MARPWDRTDQTPPVTRPARAAPPPIQRFSSELLAQLAQRTRFADPAIATRWREIAGNDLAEISRPGRLSASGVSRTLEVFATDGAAAQIIQMESAGLIARLNEFLGPRAVGRLSILQSGGQRKFDGGREDATAGAVGPRTASEETEKSMKLQQLAAFRRGSL